MKFTYGTKRSGVAPVIATLLMIAVAVSMAVIIFMWSQGFLSQTSSAAGSQQGSQNVAGQSSIAIEFVAFTTGAANSGAALTTCQSSTAATPKFTVVARDVGSVGITLGSLTISGISSNSGGFTGQITVVSVTNTAGGSVVAVSSASEQTSTWAYSTTATTASKGGSVTIFVCNTAASTTTLTNTQIKSGDTISIKLTTSVGTFAQAQYTVP